MRLMDIQRRRKRYFVHARSITPPPVNVPIATSAQIDTMGLDIPTQLGRRTPIPRAQREPGRFSLSEIAVRQPVVRLGQGSFGLATSAWGEGASAPYPYVSAQPPLPAIASAILPHVSGRRLLTTDGRHHYFWRYAQRASSGGTCTCPAGVSMSPRREAVTTNGLADEMGSGP